MQIEVTDKAQGGHTGNYNVQHPFQATNTVATVATGSITTSNSKHDIIYTQSMQEQ